MNNTITIYNDFIEIGKKKYTPDTMKKYRKIKKELFSRLKSLYSESAVKDESIEDILESLHDEEKDPVSFWGSEKIAVRNHLVFIADKEGRLFDALRRWYEAGLRK